MNVNSSNGSNLNKSFTERNSAMKEVSLRANQYGAKLDTPMKVSLAKNLSAIKRELSVELNKRRK